MCARAYLHLRLFLRTCVQYYFQTDRFDMRRVADLGDPCTCSRPYRGQSRCLQLHSKKMQDAPSIHPLRDLFLDTYLGRGCCSKADWRAEKSLGASRNPDSERER